MMSPILIVINAIFFIVPTSIPLRLLISPTICGALLCLPYRSREVANVTNLLPTPQLFSSYDPSQDQEDHPEPELSSDMLSSPSQINRWDLSSLLLGTEPFDSPEIVAFFRQPMCPSSDRSGSPILNPNSESFSSLISIASVCFFYFLSCRFIFPTSWKSGAPVESLYPFAVVLVLTGFMLPNYSEKAPSRS